MKNELINILLVEDKPGDARLIKEMLIEIKENKFNLVITESLKETLIYLENNELDIILLNLHLSDSQGVETITKVNKKNPLLPIIALTGLQEKEYAIKALNKGAQDYLSKGSFDGYLIWRVIYYAIERKKAEKKLIKEIEERKKIEKELEILITELKNSQSQLIQAEKLAALGTLTAGIAHEINNPMMGMLNFIQYCIKHTDTNDKRYSVMKDAERETKRCIEIVHNLSLFSRMDKQGLETFQEEDLNEIIQRVLKLLSYRIEKENVEIIKNIPDSLPLIQVKDSNIQQVLLNLIGNAMDAVKGKQKKFIKINIQTLNEKVKIKITDSGCGIDKKIISRVFDPFFTTKPPGKGTGLGLSVCDTIVKDHAGEIFIDSHPQNGTTFEIQLPIKQKTKLIKILVVDDEGPFNRLLVKTLKRTEKYEVESANNGSTALIKLGTFLPDILVLDINMPEMDGLEVCQALKNEPKLKKILPIIITGFRKDSRIAKIREMGYSNFYYKPLDLLQFLKDIENML